MPKPRNPAHGTYMRYAIDKCRCADCVAWKRDSDRDYRARRRAGATEPPPQRVHDAPRSVPVTHRVDPQTGEVPMTPQQQKKAELEVMLANLTPKPQPVAHYAERIRRNSEDGIERVAAGEE